MDDRTVTAALLDQFGYNESLYNVATKRIRASDTMFEDRVKLQLRPAGDEQWALLAMPYLLVCPTITRPAFWEQRNVPNRFTSKLRRRSLAVTSSNLLLA